MQKCFEHFCVYAFNKYPIFTCKMQQHPSNILLLSKWYNFIFFFKIICAQEILRKQQNKIKSLNVATFSA